MKNRLLILIAALAITVTAAGCGNKNEDNGGSASQNQQAVDVSDNYAEGASKNVDMGKINGSELSAADAENEQNKATLEDSAISIEDAILTTADGNNVIIVSYKFTNKSNNAESFNSIMKSEAFQEGLSIAHATIREDIEGFDPNSTAERIDPGKTITVQEAYLLASDTAPVTATVQEFHSESGEAVSKTFNLQ